MTSPEPSAESGVVRSAEPGVASGRGPRVLPLADRTFNEPHPSRLPAERPDRATILAAHARALEADEPGYLDPTSGLFVLTAAFLADRGTCCDRGCRHCPYAV